MRKKIRNEIVESLSVLEIKFRQIKETSQTAMFVTCVVLLQSIKKKCKSNLSEQRGAYYIEIFDGILLALQKRERLQHESLVEVCDLCTELLQFVTKELLQEKEVTKEILFLPYKASMWDSLESIWRAAAADTEHCEAYVVPIPYCDRNPDGSAAQWHCEIDLFPEDVPVVDYKAYDLPTRQPDVIYIHNPYDGNNRVTSVDPQYYSSELKKYTKRLVYVPYFVSGGSLSPHFCQLPGVINADKVIVESEFIKDVYISYYPIGKSPENKILALGSPKFDKIISSKKEKNFLPKEWSKLIRGKKIILYLTSIGSALENINSVNNKLQYIFSLFKNRTDVILWWRPHPLLKSTFQSMAPDILAEYIELEQTYIKDGWGIYDDSADLDRAIIYTDAYYGDQSSVVWLYKITGKPVLIQDISMNPELIAPSAFAVDSENIWFIMPVINGLFQLDRKTKKINFLGAFPEQSLNFRYKNLLLKNVKRELFIAPWYGNDICIYDFGENKFTKIPIQLDENLYCNFGDCFRCTGIIEYGSDLFFIGDQNIIVKYNIDKKECIYYKEWFELLKKDFNPTMELFSLNAFQVIGSHLLLPSAQSNLVLDFDLVTGAAELYRIGNQENHYIDITFDGTFCWLLSKENRLVKWNYQFNKVIAEKQIFREHVSLDAFFRIVFNGKNIVLFSSRNSTSEKFVIEVKCDDLSIRVLNDLWNKGYGFIDSSNKEIWTVDSQVDGEKIQLFDSAMQIVSTYSISLSESVKKTLEANEFEVVGISENNDLMYEECSIGKLKGFIEKVLSYSKPEVNDYQSLNKEIYGEKIYKSLYWEEVE